MVESKHGNGWLANRAKRVMLTGRLHSMIDTRLKGWGRLE
jgi:hypothetical protein